MRLPWRYTDHTCPTLQVMEKHFPRDGQGAYYRQSDDRVSDPWMQGLVSSVQLKMLKQDAQVDARENIIKHLYK